jgi:hypothetical protein
LLEAVAALGLGDRVIAPGEGEQLLLSAVNP